MSAAAEKIFDEIETPIGGVPADMVMTVWHRVEPVLRRVVKPATGYDLDAVLNELQLGQMQLWVIGDFQAVAVTRIQERPRQRVLWCQFIAGDSIEDWLDDWVAVQTEFAKAHDCAAIEFSGRQGWHKYARKFRFRDYKPVLTTFRKEL